MPPRPPGSSGFVDPAHGDYRLSAASPCRDAGSRFGNAGGAAPRDGRRREPAAARDRRHRGVRIDARARDRRAGPFFSPALLRPRLTMPEIQVPGAAFPLLSRRPAPTRRGRSGPSCSSQAAPRSRCRWDRSLPVTWNRASPSRPSSTRSGSSASRRSSPPSLPRGARGAARDPRPPRRPRLREPAGSPRARGLARAVGVHPRHRPPRRLRRRVTNRGGAAPLLRAGGELPAARGGRADRRPLRERQPGERRLRGLAARDPAGTPGPGVRAAGKPRAVQRSRGTQPSGYFRHFHAVNRFANAELTVGGAHFYGLDTGPELGTLELARCAGPTADALAWVESRVACLDPARDHPRFLLTHGPTHDYFCWNAGHHDRVQALVATPRSRSASQDTRTVLRHISTRGQLARAQRLPLGRRVGRGCTRSQADPSTPSVPDLGPGEGRAPGDATPRGRPGDTGTGDLPPPPDTARARPPRRRHRLSLGAGRGERCDPLQLRHRRGRVSRDQDAWLLGEIEFEVTAEPGGAIVSRVTNRHRETWWQPHHFVPALPGTPYLVEGATFVRRYPDGTVEARIDSIGPGEVSTVRLLPNHPTGAPAARVPGPSPAALRAIGNPFVRAVGLRLAGGTPPREAVALAVYDPTGRRVRRLVCGGAGRGGVVGRPRRAGKRPAGGRLLRAGRGQLRRRRPARGQAPLRRGVRVSRPPRSRRTARARPRRARPPPARASMGSAGTPRPRRTRSAPAVAHDPVGMGRLGDQPHGRRGHSRLPADSLGELHLVAGTGPDFLRRREAARRAVDEIHAERTQLTAQRHRLVRIPPPGNPVRGRDPHEERELVRPCLPHPADHLEGKPQALAQRAAVLVGPPVR